MMKNTFVVAIGFSEGGIKPLTSYFDFTPHDQATYIILRHLPLESRSQLQQILKHHSKLTIVEAEHDTLIEKDTVYMPPPSMYLSIKYDRLFLHPRVEQGLHSNYIIDFFLASLANAKGKFSIAVILSGGGDDGTKGAILIKEAGGMVIAQNIASCEVCAMPLNVIETGAADFELLPSEMPPIVLHHINTLLKNRNIVENLKGVGANLTSPTLL